MKEIYYFLVLIDNSFSRLTIFFQAQTTFVKHLFLTKTFFSIRRQHFYNQWQTLCSHKLYFEHKICKPTYLWLVKVHVKLISKFRCLKNINYYFFYLIWCENTFKYNIRDVGSGTLLVLKYVFLTLLYKILWLFEFIH